jgi:hypothetical protein
MIRGEIPFKLFDMNSKYRERAVALLNTQFEKNFNKPIYEWKDSKENVLETMCQLAEEVETSTKKVYVDFITAMTDGTLFTKERVEELLQQQRELSAKKATPQLDKNCSVCSYPYIDLSKHFKYIGTAIVTVNENSILNAKLKI